MGKLCDHLKVPQLCYNTGVELITLMDVKALTVYFELGLVHPDLQAEYIRQEYGKEDKFWEALDATGVNLPYVSYSNT